MPVKRIRRLEVQMEKDLSNGQRLAIGSAEGGKVSFVVYRGADTVTEFEMSLNDVREVWRFLRDEAPEPLGIHDR